MTMLALKLFLKNNVRNKFTLFVSLSRAKLASLWQEKTARVATRIFFVFLLLMIGVLIFFFQKLPSQVPLFYSLPWGEEQLAHPLFLLIFPLGSLLMGTVNLSLAIFLFERHALAAKILVLMATWLTFLNTIALLKIILLII